MYQNTDKHGFVCTCGTYHTLIGVGSFCCVKCRKSYTKFDGRLVRKSTNQLPLIQWVVDTSTNPVVNR